MLHTTKVEFCCFSWKQLVGAIHEHQNKWGVHLETPWFLSKSPIWALYWCWKVWGEGRMVQGKQFIWIANYCIFLISMQFYKIFGHISNTNEVFSGTLKCLQSNIFLCYHCFIMWIRYFTHGWKIQSHFYERSCFCVGNNMNHMNSFSHISVVDIYLTDFVQADFRLNRQNLLDQSSVQISDNNSIIHYLANQSG